MKTIVIANANSDWADGIVASEESHVYVIYRKNNNWRVYGCFQLHNQKDYDELIEEVVSETGTHQGNIRLVKPVSVSFIETSFQDLQQSKLQKQKAAAKKKIDLLKQKFGI